MLFSLPDNLAMLADYLGRSSCFKSRASPDPLAPEPEVTKPRAEGAKDEQQADLFCSQFSASLLLSDLVFHEDRIEAKLFRT